MTFVKTRSDGPQVHKNKCSKVMNFLDCACDKEYKPEPHGYFLNGNQAGPSKFYSLVFGAATIPECFVDILVPSYYHLEEAWVSK